MVTVEIISESKNGFIQVVIKEQGKKSITRHMPKKLYNKFKNFVETHEKETK